jgi:prolipoprotein diacylglyceryltransferase
LNALSSPKQLSWQGILLGTIVGAILGAAVGWVYTSTANNATRAQDPVKPFDYFKLGMAVLVAARSIGEFVERV